MSGISFLCVLADNDFAAKGSGGLVAKDSLVELPAPAIGPSVNDSRVIVHVLFVVGQVEPVQLGGTEAAG